MEFMKPDSEGFIAHFAAQFEGEDAVGIGLETEFRQLEEWTSMQSLIVIASFDEVYGLTVSAEELKSAVTINDLFLLINRKMS